MLIHGKLILTSSGLMLDEVKSLLQKALRRKDQNLVSQATKELIGRGKDQLPWKSLATFLFEDHCLASVETLAGVAQCYDNKDKYKAIRLLLSSRTCRIAACLPVVAMDYKYDPINFKGNLTVDENLKSLIAKTSGKINPDLLLINLKTAWNSKKYNELIPLFKLVSIMIDVESAVVTQKGQDYLIYQTKKPNAGHVAVSMLYKNTQDLNLKKWIKYSYKLMLVPDVCHRLIIFAILTKVLHGDSAKQEQLEPVKIDWSTVAKLTKMPQWAVDKHTFRGKFGKGTKHLLKNKNVSMNADELEMFHGERPKHGLQHFFEEGCICAEPAVEVNPYWERTKEIYYEQPHKLQKTARMTVVYAKKIKSRYPAIVYKSPKVEAGDVTSDDSDGLVIVKPKNRKRLASTRDFFAAYEPERKIAKPDDKQNKEVDVVKPLSGKWKVTKDSTTTKNNDGVGNVTSEKVAQSDTQAGVKRSIEYRNVAAASSAETAIKKTKQESKPKERPKPNGPLLQLPTGSAKVYTCLDTENNKVRKGPYNDNKKGLTLFFHKVMKDIFSDAHTLSVEDEGPFLDFPILKSRDAVIKTTNRDFYDCIGKREVKDGEFVLRETLGIVQLHKLDADKLMRVPYTIWAHFMFRYILNIGDSGLYNAITDKHLSFFYGIDMEEIRKNVKGNDILDLMFTKLPAMRNHKIIKNAIKAKKDQLHAIIASYVNFEKIDALALKYGATYDKAEVKRRIDTVLRTLKKM